jgi:hypothetical protein
MGIKEGEEVQANCIHNICNKIIAENFWNLKREIPTQVKEASRIWNTQDKNRTSPQHIIIKTTSKENKEGILKSIRDKNPITYKSKPLK